MRSFFNWCGRKLRYFVVLAIVIAALVFLPQFRDGLLSLNGMLLSWIFGTVALTAMTLTGVTLALKWFLLVLEIPILVAIVTHLVLGILRGISLTLFDVFRYSSTVIAALSSIAMGVYAYTVLWGDVKVGDTVLFHAQSIDKVTFGLGLSLGEIGAWYAVAQGLPFIFRQRVGVGWGLVDMFSSVIPLSIIGWAIISYWGGNYEWSTYRIGAMKAWGPIEILDFVNVAITMRLLTRSYQGTEEVVRLGGGGHP